MNGWCTGNSWEWLCLLASSGAFIHAKQQLQAHGDASVPAKREDTDVARYDWWTQQVLDCGRAVRVPIKHPVVSSLVFVVDPVEIVINAVLHSVLGNPLIRVTAALGQDTRNHFHLLQVNLKPLAGVLELGQPGTSKSLAI